MQMNTSLVSYATLALIAGVLIPVMAALSGAMGRTLGNPSAAAVITTTGGFLVVLIYGFATGATHISAETLSRLTPLQLLCGFGFAFYVISITFLAPRFGVGNAVMLVLAGQIVSAAAIDHFGLFGAPQKPIDWLRAVGMLIMICGVVLAQAAANASKPR